MGKNVRIGSYSDIEGECTIGDFTHIHSDVQYNKGKGTTRLGAKSEFKRRVKKNASFFSGEDL